MAAFPAIHFETTKGTYEKLERLADEYWTWFQKSATKCFISSLANSWGEWESGGVVKHGGMFVANVFEAIEGALES
jgi:hypothetical protein